MDRYTKSKRKTSSRKIWARLLLTVMALPPLAASAGEYSSIDATLKGCKAAGLGFPPGLEPVESDLKLETSLVGMAYLNYIYQNDILNPHFCQAMLLMRAQVPAGTDNPFVHLFTPDFAAKTMASLADVQLAFDHAIARSNPATDKMEASLMTLRGILK